MAKAADSSDTPDLTPDPIASAAGSDRPAISVRGILGESSDPECVRIFLDTEFGTYYDIPREAIVAREALPAERSPIGVDGSTVLVRPGTSLRVHRVTSRPIEQEFLAGDFTAPGTLRSYSELGAQPRRAQPMYIPSKTTMTYDCCDPVSEGCWARASNTEGSWPTGSGAGCTEMSSCIC